MKSVKRVFAVLLCAVILLGAVPLTGIKNVLPEADAAYAVGSIIYFGSYPQESETDTYTAARLAEQIPDVNGNITYKNKKYRRIDEKFYELQPIAWRVLSSDEDGTFVVSEKVLDSQPYNTVYKDITWADSTLRTWLNGYFYNVAFTSSEKAKINNTHLINGDNPSCGTEGGIDTYDKVFLLSIADALDKSYGFSSSTDSSATRVAQPTGYAEKRGVSCSSSSYGAYWWLRTPGYCSSKACTVNDSGYVDDYYYFISVSSTSVGVRPALILNRKSGIYQSKDYYSYSIKAVDDETGSPISGANVTFDGSAVGTTSASGTVTLSIGAQSDSTKEIRIAKSGYSDLVLKLYELNAYGSNTVKMSKEFGISEKLADVCLDGETIYGPMVNILGQKFNLFKFDAKISIPLTGISISAKQDTTNHTVKVILGLKDEYKYDSDAKWNEDYAKFKDYYQGYTGKSNSECLSKYRGLRDKLKSEDGDLGFGCSMTYAGFMEFDYSTGSLVLKSGGIVVTAEANVSTDVPFAYICYATFKIGGEIEGKFTIEPQSSGTLGLTAKISLSVKPTIGVGVKLISKDVASVEAGIDGKITGSVTIPSSSFKNAFNAYLEAQCYVKAKALWVFEGKWSTNFPHLELYPNFGSLVSSSITEDDLELIDRSYINTLKTQSLGDINEQDVYPYGNPQLVTLADGRVVALYLYDDGTKSAINRTTLYYSIFENDTWSVPMAVNNSGFADFPVKVCTDGTKIYALWQRGTEVYPDSYKVDDIVTKTELVYSEFDGTAWSVPVTVDTAGSYQLLYGIAQSGGEVSVTWSENSANDYTLNDGTTSVYTKTLSAGAWGAQQTVAASAGIFGAAVGYINGTLNTAYAVDADGDYTTANDSDIYINGTKVTDGDNDFSQLSYQNGSFWYCDGDELVQYNGTAVPTGLKVGTDYRVINNGNTTAVTYIKDDGFKNELQVSYLKADGTYTDGVNTTDYSKHISSYDACLNADGNILFLGDVDNLSGDPESYPYTSTDFVCNTITKTTDVTLGDVAFGGLQTRGGTLNVTASVTNNGTNAINGTVLKLTDASGNTLRTYSDTDTLLPGASKTLSFDYVLSESFTKQNLTLTAQAENDTNTADNAYTYAVGAADISIIGESVSRDGVVTATVVNNGCDTAVNTNVLIKAAGEQSDTDLTTVSCGNILPGGTYEISYTVPSEYKSFSSYYTVNKFLLSASTDSSEQSLGNNGAEAVLAPIAAESISISAQTLSVLKGSKTQLSATVTPSDALNKTVHWVSDSTNIATVDDNGLVTAAAGGKAIITAISDDGGFVAQCEVTVNVPAAGIDMSDSVAVMNVGEIKNFTFSFNPDDATNTAVSWKSSDTTVATVTSDGSVTALKSGAAVITVTAADGGYTSTCNLTVVNKVKGILITDSSISLVIGKTKQLTAQLTPIDADNQNIVWSSDAEDVATVSSAGLVTAESTGTATITARSADGGYTATCTVNVVKRVTGVVLSETAATVTLGTAHRLTATVLPLTATNRSVVWVSTNTNVATVDANGLITAVGTGTAVIVAETNDGSFTATCSLTVKNAATGFALGSNAENVVVGSSVKLDGVFSPNNTPNKNINWTSSDNAVATVTADGVVTAHKKGSAVITATAEDGGYKDFCLIEAVEVSTKAASEISVDTDNMFIYNLPKATLTLDSVILTSDTDCTVEVPGVSGYIGTGSVVNIVKNGKVIGTYTAVVMGDLNGDGIVDAMDALLSQQATTGNLQFDTDNDPKGAFNAAADTVNDGQLDASDYSAVINECLK